jgi:xanthine dehydrogenase YagT iron-sulfur-binding subunit
MKRKTPEKSEEAGRSGLNRRGFLTFMGVSAVVSVGAGQAAGQAAGKTPPEPTDPCEMTRVKLRINGRLRRLLVEPRWSLLFVLREKFGLTGTKMGCERGECGACTVLIDGEPRYACLTLALEAEGKEITTLEGLMKGEELGPVQQAFQEQDALQCGYCTPGQIMAVEGLLRRNPDPSPEEIQRGISGNLCRCGTYPHIFKAARRAAELKRGKGGAG